ncbi:MAG: hypothetical protein H6718_29055 [Polyangiaceae bacterium]|nr:hypothetical protein [Myxococcales bacterium]MCB9589498.1 hypothetical protein [Polyangiaceae bacterium]MCB9609935.1 hypothetical protein [Polyangiaceae bacterium]
MGGTAAGGDAGSSGSAGQSTGGVASVGGSAGLGASGGSAGLGGSAGGAGAGGGAGANVGGAASAAGSSAGGATGGTGGTSSSCAAISGVSAPGTDWELLATDPGAEGGVRPRMVDFDVNPCGIAFLTYQLPGAGFFISTWGANGFEPLGERNTTYPFTDAAAVVVDVGDDGVPFVAWRKNGEIGVARWSGSTWDVVGGTVTTGYLGAFISLPAGPALFFLEGAYGSRTVGAKIWDGTEWQAMGSQPILGVILETSIWVSRDSRGRALLGNVQNFVWDKPDWTEQYAMRWDGTDWAPLGGDHGPDPWGDNWRKDITAIGGDVPVTSSTPTVIKFWNGANWQAYPALPYGTFAFAKDWTGELLVLKAARFVDPNLEGQVRVLRMESGTWNQMGTDIADGIRGEYPSDPSIPYVVSFKVGVGENARWVAMQTNSKLEIRAWGR